VEPDHEYVGEAVKEETTQNTPETLLPVLLAT
jgi:hypothetical protein